MGRNELPGPEGGPGGACPVLLGGMGGMLFWEDGGPKEAELGGKGDVGAGAEGTGYDGYIGLEERIEVEDGGPLGGPTPNEFGWGGPATGWLGPGGGNGPFVRFGCPPPRGGPLYGKGRPFVALAGPAGGPPNEDVGGPFVRLGCPAGGPPPKDVGGPGGGPFVRPVGGPTVGGPTKVETGGPGGPFDRLEGGPSGGPPNDVGGPPNGVGCGGPGC